MIEGREAERRVDSTVVKVLTTRGRKAAERFNERQAARGDGQLRDPAERHTAP